jgi:hypothetical protein
MATMTMTSMDPTATFPRSHSSSVLPDLVSSEFKRQENVVNSELPRSASFSSVPGLLENPSYAKDPIRSSSAEGIPLAITSEFQQIPEENEKPAEEVKKEERPKERMGRRKSLVAGPKSWIQKVKGSEKSTLERKESVLKSTKSPAKPAAKSDVKAVAAPAAKVERPSPTPIVTPQPRDKSKTLSGSFSGRFNRKSWISTTSRSPSPTRFLSQDPDLSSREDEDTSTAPSSLASSSPSLPSSVPVVQEPPSQPSPSTDEAPPIPTPTTVTPAKPVARKGTLLKKKNKRPSSMMITSSTLKAANFSTSSLPPASTPVSANGTPKSSPRQSSERVPSIPKSYYSSSERLPLLEIPRRRDELWSSFRSLDTDFQKFQAKSSALKTNVVRASLLPFLRNHVHHPSNKTLRPEDVDRRVNILNKWWTGILEMLDGHSNQSVSGVDRPVLLDAITGIMTRPEWRLYPSQFAPLRERSHGRLPRSRSSGSLKSTASQFLAESVFHNVRNMFIQNLLSQINLVVDKMSLRHAPASLVTFCGKAAAYAFFFCPGVADQLVKLWAVPTETIRRVVDEFGLSRHQLGGDFSEDLINTFPPNLHSLAWTSVAGCVKHLRQNPNLPLGAAKIQWNGPWVARWCGRDSDMFFVFCKHYHILAEEFMPVELPLNEKARAPGFVLVHAQILTALDATVHRQAANDLPLPLTFDDVLSGTDASANALPLPSSNVARLMAENRLIMLLRDFLSDRPSDFETARQFFAESFSAMMRATAKRVSLFDHNACFVLCDLMEESLAIFIRYHHARLRSATDETALAIASQDFVNWGFWLEVCKKILQSQNSMSEIRLFSFIYGAWNILVSDEKRKEVLCLQWLLTEETFEKMFSHWCPMVRAYYMRLLVWRVARHDGETATPLDT